MSLYVALFFFILNKCVNTHIAMIINTTRTASNFDINFVTDILSNPLFCSSVSFVVG